MEQKKGIASFVHIPVYQIENKMYDDVVKCLFLLVSVCVYKMFYKNNEIYIVLHTWITV